MVHTINFSSAVIVIVDDIPKFGFYFSKKKNPHRDFRDDVRTRMENLESKLFEKLILKKTICSINKNA